MVLYHSLGLELFYKELSYEEKSMYILAKYVGNLRTCVIPYVKVQWRNQNIEKGTCEMEVDMHKWYPHLFIDLGTFLFSYVSWE